MIESITALPPFAYLGFAVIAVILLPKLIGHLIAAFATALVVIQSYLFGAVEPGSYIDITFLGFDVVFLYIDDASRIVAFVVGLLATAAVIYSYASEAKRPQTAFAMAYVASTIGTIYAGDWLSMIFFWELMAITSTLLVWHYGTREAVRAGYRYAIFHGIGGTILIGAVIAHFVTVGPAVEAFRYDYFAGIADGYPTILAAIGIGINCGFILLHSWIPDTYPRPHIAASVFLSVFTTKTAVFIMYRAFPDGAMWLAYLGGAMAVYGVFFALLQYDPRRLLSYHIQAQVGYMLAGIGLAALGGEIGRFAIAGGLAHLVNNILFKALLFMAVGVVIYRTQEQNIQKLGGLWNVMPLAFLAYILGAASITAIPGTNGFVSKGMVLDAANEVNNMPLLLGEDLLWWLLIVGAIGTFLSFIKLGYYIFFHGENSIEPRDATPGQSLAMLSIGAVCLLFGLLPGILFSFLPFTDTVIDIADPFSTGHLTEAAILFSFSFIAFFILKNPISKLAWIPDVHKILYPAAFFAGKFAVLAVTELWAAVDRFVMNAAAVSIKIGSNPGKYAYDGLKRIPGISVESVSSTTKSDTIILKASIGTSIFLITTALVLFLLFLL